MSSMKTLVILALLAAVGYGVYLSMTRNPRQAADSGGVAPAWTNNTPAGNTPAPPNVQMPGSSNKDFASAGGQSNTAPISLAPPTTSLGGSTAGASSKSLATRDAAKAPASSIGSSGAPRDIPPPSESSPAPGYPAIDDAKGSGVILAGANTTQTADGDGMGRFTAFMQMVQSTLDEGKLDEGLRTLTLAYKMPELTGPPAKQVAQLLDQVAGTVIYSRRHLIEPAYKVQPGERLDQIAQKYNVPWELLARINGLRNPERLATGQELKVVRGPFSAVVNLDRCEMTLMLQDRYAGRFPIGVGRDYAKLEGTYTVRDKITNPIYQGPDGIQAGAGANNNPYGKFLLDLGNHIGIHGTSDQQNVGRNEGRGSICLSDRDIDDVFGILSIGSQVVVQR
jgi:LysM repeat protein